MEDESDDLDPEFVKRMGERAVRTLHRKMGWLPITEWTQEDFDQEMKAAMWRAEPDDDDFDDTTD
jgi:hypothetical protein